MNVQIQKGGSDCGPLTIAFAAAICNGQKTELITFNQETLRSELLRAKLSQHFQAKVSKERQLLTLKRYQFIVAVDSLKKVWYGML